MECFVYILYSERYRRYYVGQSNDCARRLMYHNAGYEKWTKPYRPWVLIHCEVFDRRKMAMQREKYLKSLKSTKALQKYIAGWRSSTLPGS